MSIFDDDGDYASGLSPNLFDQVVLSELTRWVAARTERVAYRPGWSVEIHRVNQAGMADVPVVRVMARVADSRDLNSTQLVAHSHPVPLDLLDFIRLALVREEAARAEKRWFRWLFELLGRIERHERAEWFRVDGVRLADPHGPAGYTGERWTDVEFPLPAPAG